MSKLSNAKVVGFFSMPPLSMAEANPEAYCKALAALPDGCGSCSHCGMAIIYHVVIVDDAGKRRFIGTTCAEKVGLNSDQIRNRMTDDEVALRKAAEQSDIDVANSGVFTFGKYQGRRVDDVAASDFGYIQWLAFSGSPNGYQNRAINILQCKSHVDARANAEKSAKANRVGQIIEALGADVVREYADANDGKFCANVCSDLLRGVLPSDNALNSMAQIVAKRYGRTNSKAYKAAYDLIFDKLGI
jgi:uncharacterized protein (DUF3820 family)